MLWLMSEHYEININVTWCYDSIELESAAHATKTEVGVWALEVMAEFSVLLSGLFSYGSCKREAA